MKKSDEDIIPIPESYTRRQLNALYREIPLKDTTSRTLRKYFNAMANLYGIITLREAFEVISFQDPKLVSEAEFLAFAEIARHECEDYLILGDDELYKNVKTGSPLDRKIIDTVLFFRDDEAFDETMQGQSGKPLYVPEKKRLLLYNDRSYCDEIPEVTALRTFLREQLGLSEIREQRIFEDILNSCRYGIDDTLGSVLDMLEKYGIAFETETDMRKFGDLFEKFHNTTRMQLNRGHTPNEMFKMYREKGQTTESVSLGPNIRRMIAEGRIDPQEIRREILTTDLPSEGLRIGLLKELAQIEAEFGKNAAPKKVGRNDPCPCGSGKKYKKCCGRGQ